MKNSKKKQLLKFLKSKKLGLILGTIQAFLSFFMLGLLIYLNMIPIKYFLPVVFVIILLDVYVVATQFSKKFRTFGKISSAVFIVLMLIASIMLMKANDVLDSITGADKKTSYISAYVLKDDPAKSITDASEYTFGILATIDRENTNTAVESINTKLESTINTVEYSDFKSLVDALYNKEIQSIILNEGFVSTIEEMSDDSGNSLYPNFSTDTRVLSTKKIVTKVDTGSNTNVTKDPFMLYLSGIDVEGAISTTSRSDVNIIAVVNPKTKQVLLLSTPRDYYVPTTVSGGVPDKLTHAGLYGVDCSIGTLNMLYNININYYFRINFTGFQDVIDALDGITVNSDYDFVTTHGGDHIVVGENSLNGKEALGFARERYAFADGDRQRGRNQMEVISAVIKKTASSAVLNNYSDLMNSLKGSFETSMSSSDISSLVKMQLDDMASWNVVSYSVSGSGAKKTTYSMPGFNAYVMIPDDTYVENAKILINQVVSGATINKDELAETTSY